MVKKYYLFLILIVVFCISCSVDNDITIPRNLQEYIDTFNSKDLGNVIACAANADGNTSLTYVFYYPKEGATDICYFEADSLSIPNENNFESYKKISLTNEDVFGGKLQRFSRSGSDENWSIVTFILDGRLHISNPIRLKNSTVPTTWKSEVDINQTQSLQPIFTWSDFGITENDIYFQVISDEDVIFISGTYTNDNYFQYYDTSNVVLNINIEPPADLVLDSTYNFTLMGVSKDNWVNLMIQDSFVTE